MRKYENEEACNMANENMSYMKMSLEENDIICNINGWNERKEILMNENNEIKWKPMKSY